MTKFEYILKQLAKTNKKNYENYVVTRIWHQLNSLEYKFITQQYVIRPNGNYALTDMFYPQLNLHIEVDEAHHLSNVENDITREHDIINITGHKILRINVCCSIEEVNQQIDNVCKEIIAIRTNLGDRFTVWDIEKEISPETYIRKGYIDIADNVAFRRIVDAINCFGANYKGWQKGGSKHPVEKDVQLWFPKLYKNGAWDNSVSSDNLTIYEKPINSEYDTYLTDIVNSNGLKRIVFARVIDSLGFIMYRFMGYYELNVAQSRNLQTIVWERKGTRVKTYSYS